MSASHVIHHTGPGWAGGSVRLGGRLEEIGMLDVVYVAPHDVHRFQADDSETLGFVCIVDRDRDRPEPVEDNGAES